MTLFGPKHPKCKYCGRETSDLWFYACCGPWQKDYLDAREAALFCPEEDKCDEHHTCGKRLGQYVGKKVLCSDCKPSKEYIECLEYAGMI